MPGFFYINKRQFFLSLKIVTLFVLLNYMVNKVVQMILSVNIKKC